MDQDHTQDLRRFFVALSDETRLRMIALILDEALSSREMGSRLKMKDAAVAKHLSLLVESGIVCQEEFDGGRIYRLNVAELRDQRARLLGRDRSPSPADEPGTPEWERQVLRNFFDGDRLKEIPANRKKRMVVLTWLARQFDADRRYPEREVNELIKRHHPDTAALRRQLVDEQFMRRENGLYWRTSSLS
jgi:DNA-binding transcriptional ArsR family regulator